MECCVVDSQAASGCCLVALGLKQRFSKEVSFHCIGRSLDPLGQWSVVLTC